MTPDLFDIPENAPVDPQIVKDAVRGIHQFSKDFVQGKMDEIKLVQQSAAEGGPTSPGEGVMACMDLCNMGIRDLANRVKVPRKKLLRMLNGEIPWNAEIGQKIEAVFEKIGLSQRIDAILNKDA